MLRIAFPLLLLCAAAPAIAQPSSLNPQMDYDGYRALIDEVGLRSPPDRLESLQRGPRAGRLASPPLRGQFAEGHIRRRGQLPLPSSASSGSPRGCAIATGRSDLLQQQLPQRQPAGHAENRPAGAKPVNLHPPLRLWLSQHPRAQRRRHHGRSEDRLGGRPVARRRHASPLRRCGGRFTAADRGSARS